MSGIGTGQQRLFDNSFTGEEDRQVDKNHGVADTAADRLAAKSEEDAAPKAKADPRLKTNLPVRRAVPVVVLRKAARTTMHAKNRWPNGELAVAARQAE